MKFLTCEFWNALMYNKEKTLKYGVCLNEDEMKTSTFEDDICNHYKDGGDNATTESKD
jgi:hypothetical protein